MKFFDLDGRQRGIDITKFKRRNVSKSQGQQRLGDWLAEHFPNCGIFEEFPCVGTRLKLDFFIPTLKIAYEFDGSQHQKYNPHFHGDRYGFARSQTNDNDKLRWCEVNGIELIRVTDEELEELLSEE